MVVANPIELFSHFSKNLPLLIIIIIIIIITNITISGGRPVEPKFCVHLKQFLNKKPFEKIICLVYCVLDTLVRFCFGVNASES
jgi:hypothetical protein